MFQFADRSMKVFKRLGIADRKKMSGGNKKNSGQEYVKDQKINGR